MARRLSDQVDHWLFEEYRTSADDLAVFRMFFAVAAVAIYFPRALWSSALPVDFWDTPPGPMSMFEAPPELGVMWLLNGLYIACCIGVFVGDVTKLSSIGLGLTLLALNSVKYSFGKIDHDVLFPLTAILMAFSGWESSRSYDADGGSEPQTKAWPIAFVALMIGVGMLTAAWPKLLGGWLDPSTLAVRSAAVRHQEALQIGTPGTRLALAHTPRWLWEAQDWAAVILEAGLIVAALRRRWFQNVLIVAILFHMGVLIVLGIPFGFSVSVYALFFPAKALVRPAKFCLPLAFVLAAGLCNWNGWNMFFSQTIVMLGGLLAIGYLASWPWRRH